MYRDSCDGGFVLLCIELIVRSTLQKRIKYVEKHIDISIMSHIISNRHITQLKFSDKYEKFDLQ